MTRTQGAYYIGVVAGATFALSVSTIFTYLKTIVEFVIFATLALVLISIANYAITAKLGKLEESQLTKREE